MKALVLDGSFILSILLKDEFSPAVISAVGKIRTVSSHAQYVPGHFWLEVTNALLMAERRKRITATEVAESMRIAFSWPLVTDEETSLRCKSETPELARVYGLTAYDAAYLELALRRNADLATVDRELARAAKSAGVHVLG